MREQKTIGLSKKLMASLLLMTVVLSGIAITPSVVRAEENVGEIVETVDEAIYSSNYFSIKDYYSTKTAPVKENYVFGGWYQKVGEGFQALSETEASELADGTNETNAYAKFVPAYVLSVKAQNAEGTKADMTEKTSVRIITSVDSKKYQKVGFEIYLGNGTKLLTQGDGSALETSRVYKGIKIGTDKTKTATQIFGAASKHVAVWELTNIIPKNHSKIICVRPYWITMDGTTVKGLGKYVHIEDDYKNYISVPVNLLTGETVAAGMMSITYNQALTFVDFEEGRLLPDMAHKHDTNNKTIKMVGNAKNVSDLVTADGIYANIRFAKPNATTVFDVTVQEFCNWAEESVTTLKAWDITYAAE